MSTSQRADKTEKVTTSVAADSDNNTIDRIVQQIRRIEAGSSDREEVHRLARDVLSIDIDKQQHQQPQSESSEAVVDLLRASQRLIEHLVDHQYEQQSRKNVRHAQENELIQENVKLRRLLQLHQNMIANRRLNIGTTNNNNNNIKTGNENEGGEATAEDIIDSANNNNNTQPTKLPCLYCPKTFGDAGTFSKHLEQRHLAVLSTADIAKQTAPLVEYLQDKMANNGNVQMVQNMQMEIETLNRRLAATQQTLDEERHARQMFEEGLSLRMMGQVEEIRQMIQANTIGDQKTDEDNNKELEPEKTPSTHKDEKPKDKQIEQNERPKKVVIENKPAKDEKISNSIPTTEDMMLESITSTDPLKASVKQQLLDQLITKRSDKTKVVEDEKTGMGKTQKTNDKKKMVEVDISNTLEERLNSYLNNSNKRDNEHNNNNNSKPSGKNSDDDRYVKAMDEVKRDRNLLIEQSRHDYNFVEIEENIRNQIDSRLQSIISQTKEVKVGGGDERSRTSSVPISIPTTTTAPMNITSSRFTLKRVTDEDLKREEEEEEERQSRSLSTSPLKSILKHSSSSSLANGARNRSQSLSGKPLASQLARRRISFNDELTEYQISPLASDDSSEDDDDENETAVKESMFSFESPSDDKDEDGAIVYIENPR